MGVKIILLRISYFLFYFYFPSYLSGQINKLEMNISEFQNKEIIVLTLDSLNQIPEEIGRLTNAIHLTIRRSDHHGNWFVYPPLSWFENREYKEPLNKIPESIGNLEDLRSLNLVNLDIHELPKSIILLQNLEFLDLSLNKLDVSKELPKLEKLKSLKHLRILGNRYQKEEMEEFKSEFPNIKVEYTDEDS